ncbi:MAG: DUF2029 domain-containing protein [Anaerolineales bacterium]|nr:DUF2029 domain-containing protein [Anaerolineales bacterium]
MKSKLRGWAFLAISLAPYLAYLSFIIQLNQGPIDYETFMQIGQRWRDGAEVYVENSYYPLPYVMIFAAFSALPRPLSMALWLGWPVLAVLIITRGRAWALWFAPVFAHFVGGQSSALAMLGLWGFRRNLQTDSAKAGMWLSLMTLKPQLGLLPILFAVGQWYKLYRATGRVPRSAWSFGLATAAIYLPSFILMPDWPVRWLSVPRPFFERALAGFVPRTLWVLLGEQTVAIVVLWLILTGLILAGIWRATRRFSLEALVLWGFVVNPLVHDYDLLQLVPVLEDKKLAWAAVLASLPTWWVILFAYNVDAAWYLVTLIAPVVLFMYLGMKTPGSATPPPETAPPR